MIARVNAEVTRAARSPELSEQFARQGAELALSTPAALAATLSAEVAKWEKVVRAAGIERQ